MDIFEVSNGHERTYRVDNRYSQMQFAELEYVINALGYSTIVRFLSFLESPIDGVQLATCLNCSKIISRLGTAHSPTSQNSSQSSSSEHCMPTATSDAHTVYWDISSLRVTKQCQKAKSEKVKCKSEVITLSKLCHSYS